MPLSLNEELLGRTLLFEGLTPRELATVRALLRRTTIPARTLLMSVDQPGDAAYVILSGTVKIHVEQPSGGDVILAILGTGEVIGEMSLVERLGVSANVMALEDSDLAVMDRVAFQAALRDIPLLAHNLNRILSRRLRLANAHIQSLASQKIPGRVARLLLSFAQEYGRPGPEHATTTIPLRLTQEDLGSMAGASRAQVNRVLSQLKREGTVSQDRALHITIHSLAALEDLCLI
jgi:CRP/FNR family transcriptional regulator, cyclic AMP receptor protein